MRGGILSAGVAAVTQQKTTLGVRARRLALELHGPPDDMRLSTQSNSYHHHHHQDSQQRENVNQQQPQQQQDALITSLRDHEIVVVRLYKEEEEETTLSLYPPPEDKDSSSDDDDDENKDKTAAQEGFLSMRSYRVEEIAVLEQKKNICVIQVGHGDEIKVYDVLFESKEESVNFCQQFNQLRDWELARSKRQAELYKEKQKHKTTPGGGEKHAASVNLLVEIVSATNLPESNNAFGLPRNPFVMVKMGGSEIHRTKAISHTLDPVWSLETGSLFLVQRKPEDFFSSTGGITFLVSDAPTIATTKALGRVRIGLQDMLNMQGSRERFEIALEKDVPASSSPSALYLRIKEASKSDIEVSLHDMFLRNKKLRPNAH